MANSVGTNPVRLDTFGADVTIKATGRVVVDSIVITGYTDPKTVTFIDAAGAVVLVAECAAAGTESVSGPLTFTNGLIFDDDASDVAAGDFVFIFLH